MAEGGTIGAATPVEIGAPGGAAQPVAEKTVSYMRAADAAQLAAALVWCRERPKQRPLVCFDERLRAAATAVGFSVRP